MAAVSGIRGRAGRGAAATGLAATAAALLGGDGAFRSGLGHIVLGGVPFGRHGGRRAGHAPGHGLAYVDFAGNRYRGGITRESFSVQPPAMLLGRFGGFRSFQSIGQEHGGSVNEVPARALPALPPQA